MLPVTLEETVSVARNRSCAQCDPLKTHAGTLNTRANGISPCLSATPHAPTVLLATLNIPKLCDANPAFLTATTAALTPLMVKSHHKLTTPDEIAS